jgi:hypothetical protein
MKVTVWNQNCILAGQPVSQREIDETEDGTAGDWTVYEGSATELLEIAQARLNSKESGGNGAYDRRVGKNIAQAVYFERPDLQLRGPLSSDEMEIED